MGHVLRGERPPLGLPAATEQRKHLHGQLRLRQRPPAEQQVHRHLAHRVAKGALGKGGPQPSYDLEVVIGRLRRPQNTLDEPGQAYVAEQLMQRPERDQVDLALGGSARIPGPGRPPLLHELDDAARQIAGGSELYAALQEIEQEANAARDNADRAAYDGVGLGHPPARDADCGCRWRGASPYNGYLDDYSGDKDDDVVVLPATRGR